MVSVSVLLSVSAAGAHKARRRFHGNRVVGAVRHKRIADGRIGVRAELSVLPYCGNGKDISKGADSFAHPETIGHTRNLYRVFQRDFRRLPRLPLARNRNRQHGFGFIGIAVQDGFAIDLRAAHHQCAGGKPLGIDLPAKLFFKGAGRGIHVLKGVGPCAQHRRVLILPCAVEKPHGLTNAQRAHVRIELRINDDFIQSFGRPHKSGRRRRQFRQFPGKHPENGTDQQHGSSGQRPSFAAHQISAPTLLSRISTRSTTPPMSSPPTTPHNSSVSPSEMTTHRSLPNISCWSGRAVIMPSMPAACT